MIFYDGENGMMGFVDGREAVELNLMPFSLVGG